MPQSAIPAACRFTADCAPGIQLQRFLQFGANLQLTYTTSKWAFNAQSFATPLQALDPQRNQLNQVFTHGTNDGVKALAYNQSSLTAIRNIFTHRSEKGTVGKTAQIGLRGGYFYSQHAYRGSLDYLWAADAPDGGYICVSGSRSHSVAIGGDFRFEHNSEQKTVNHHFYADVLCGFAMQLTGFGHTPEQGNPDYFTAKGSYYEAVVPNGPGYPKDRIGTRFGYELRIYGRKGLGILCGFEGQWKPGITYHSSPERYVARGGERTLPAVGAIKAGLTYRFSKHP